MPTAKTKRLKRKTKTNQEYLDYVSNYNKRTGSDKQPMTRYHWGRSGRRTGYGVPQGTSELAHLRRKERKAIGMKD